MPDANVNVIGQINEGMGGLKESLGAFRKHHQQVGDALLNISGIDTTTGGSVDKDEPRPAYSHQAFPRMVYHADGRELIVSDDSELKAALKAQYRTTSYPVPQVAVNDPRHEKKELLDRNAALQGQISTLSDQLQKALDRLDALEK